MKIVIDCWSNYTLHGTAATMGLEPVIYDFETVLDEASNEQEANDKILHDMAQINPDFLLIEEGVGHKRRHVTRKTIRKLKKRGIRTGFIEWNVPYRDGKTIEGIRKRFGDYPEEYDVRFFSYNEAVECYSNMGLETHFVRKMYDSRVYPPRPSIEQHKEYDIAICGTAYDRPKPFSRKSIAFHCLSKKYSLALCGKNWGKEGVGYISGDPKLAKLTMGKLPQRMLPAIYGKSRINIGTLLVDYSGYLGARPFEVLGTNNFFMLGNVNQDVRDIFIDGEDMVYFESLEDLYEKIEYYIGKPEERDRIARNAFLKTKRNFTYRDSCKFMLERLCK